MVRAPQTAGTEYSSFGTSHLFARSAFVCVVPVLALVCAMLPLTCPPTNTSVAEDKSFFADPLPFPVTSFYHAPCLGASMNIDAEYLFPNRQPWTETPIHQAKGPPYFCTSRGQRCRRVQECVTGHDRDKSRPNIDWQIGQVNLVRVRKLSMFWASSMTCRLTRPNRVLGRDQSPKNSLTLSDGRLQALPYS